ncbi:response regulator transcription factor [Filimonas effusa]|uniref:Response regulator transcription factor n=1 Tax=Filimonas effusa TaxID=2508721 RepID=A0A4Q1D371_9BACT|nr:response regulator transcription factor [Filimonas effusa]RXK82852.1 response regulator transcription factor [Filimonas effusa]
MKRARIIIADDHQLLIDGLTAVLQTEPAWEVLEAVNNGRQLLDRLANTKPDLVLLDLNMPRLDGIQALTAISKNYPEVKVLVISNYNQPQLQADVRKLGAAGYLLKNISAALLKEAITRVLAGGTCFEEQATPPAADEWFPDDFMKKYQLTRREIEIVKLIGKELSTKEIADQLFLSELTVATHRKNILRKLEVKNIAGVVNFIRMHHLE